MDPDRTFSKIVDNINKHPMSELVEDNRGLATMTTPAVRRTPGVFDRQSFILLTITVILYFRWDNR